MMQSKVAQSANVLAKRKPALRGWLSKSIGSLKFGAVLDNQL